MNFAKKERDRRRKIITMVLTVKKWPTLRPPYDVLITKRGEFTKMFALRAGNKLLTSYTSHVAPFTKHGRPADAPGGLGSASSGKLEAYFPEAHNDPD